MLLVLPPTFKPVSKKKRLLQVARILTSGVTPYTGVTQVAAKQVCLGRVKRATFTEFVAESRTTLYFLQQIFATCNNLICCKTGLNVGSKTSIHRFSTCFVAMLQNKLHVFVARFTVN